MRPGWRTHRSGWGRVATTPAGSKRIIIISRYNASPPPPTLPFSSRQSPTTKYVLAGLRGFESREKREGADSPIPSLSSQSAAPSTPAPSCSACGTLPLRPYFCLTCEATFCRHDKTASDHAASHAANEQHHLGERSPRSHRRVRLTFEPHIR
jgi:hypothetical protein